MESDSLVLSEDLTPLLLVLIRINTTIGGIHPGEFYRVWLLHTEGGSEPVVEDEFRYHPILLQSGFIYPLERVAS